MIYFIVLCVTMFDIFIFKIYLFTYVAILSAYISAHLKRVSNPMEL